MKWLAARAYEEIQRILSDETLAASLDLEQVIVGSQDFKAAATGDGLALLDRLNAVIIEPRPGDDITYANIAHHHELFNLRVTLYRDTTDDINQITATQDALSELLEVIVENYQPISLTDGHLYSIEPGKPVYDEADAEFWETAGLPIASGYFDITIKAQAN